MAKKNIEKKNKKREIIFRNLNLALYCHSTEGFLFRFFCLRGKKKNRKEGRGRESENRMASESSPADFVSNSEGDDLKDKGKKEKKKEKRIFGKKKRNRSLMKQLKTTSQQDLKPTPARPISCLGQFTSCHDFRSATENFPDSTSSEALRSSFSARPSSSSSSSSPGHSFEEGSLSSSGENRRLRRINISGNRRVSNSAQSLPSVDDRKDHFESFLKSFNLLEYRGFFFFESLLSFSLSLSSLSFFLLFWRTRSFVAPLLCVFFP